MKQLSILLVTTLILSSCARPKAAVNDPIDTLVANLNASHGFWINGLYPDINLPSDAKPEEVLAAAVKVTKFDQGYVKTFNVQSVRQVEVMAAGQETFSVALVDTDFGRKIFMFRPESNNRWWTRFYNINKEEQNL